MSFRPGLLPSLLRAVPHARTAPSRSFHFLPEAGARVQARSTSRVVAEARAVSRQAPRQSSKNNALLFSAGLGLAGFMLYPKSVHCDDTPQQLPQGAVPTYSAPPGKSRPDGVPEEAKSILNVGELSFGAACGICAGVFVKKGFKLVAFALGGVFVLLQVSASLGHLTLSTCRPSLSSRWTGIRSRAATTGSLALSMPMATLSTPLCPGCTTALLTSSPQTSSVGSGQQTYTNHAERATFLAGFLLGLRVG